MEAIFFFYFNYDGVGYMLVLGNFLRGLMLSIDYER